MARKRPLQKLISFTENPSDLERIRKDISEGWNIVSLVPNGNFYIGIMEKNPDNESSSENPKLFLPAKKKIKIHTH